MPMFAIGEDVTAMRLPVGAEAPMFTYGEIREIHINTTGEKYLLDTDSSNWYKPENLKRLTRKEFQELGFDGLCKLFEVDMNALKEAARLEYEQRMAQRENK